MPMAAASSGSTGSFQQLPRGMSGGYGTQYVSAVAPLGSAIVPMMMVPGGSGTSGGGSTKKVPDWLREMLHKKQLEQASSKSGLGGKGADEDDDEMDMQGRTAGGGVRGGLGVERGVGGSSGTHRTFTEGASSHPQVVLYVMRMIQRRGSRMREDR
jgi:hypothetical protein